MGMISLVILSVAVVFLFCRIPTQRDKTARPSDTLGNGTLTNYHRANDPEKNSVTPLSSPTDTAAQDFSAPPSAQETADTSSDCKQN